MQAEVDADQEVHEEEAAEHEVPAEKDHKVQAADQEAAEHEASGKLESRAWPWS